MRSSAKRAPATSCPLLRRYDTSEVSQLWFGLTPVQPSSVAVTRISGPSRSKAKRERVALPLWRPTA
jgi:hypothetical protein